MTDIFLALTGDVTDQFEEEVRPKLARLAGSRTDDVACLASLATSVGAPSGLSDEEERLVLVTTVAATLIEVSGRAPEADAVRDVCTGAGLEALLPETLGDAWPGAIVHLLASPNEPLGALVAALRGHPASTRDFVATLLAAMNELRSRSPGLEPLRSFRHRVAEDRGVLTGILHNATKRVLERELGARAILAHPEGFTYLGPDTNVELARLLEAVTAEFEAGLRNVTRSNLAKLVRRREFGIVIDPEALEVGSPEEIAPLVRAQAEREDWPEGGWLAHNTRPNRRPQIDAFVARGFALPRTRLDLQRGALLCGIKNALREPLEKLVPASASEWSVLEKRLGVPEPLRAALDETDATYDHGHLLAANLPGERDLESLAAVLADLWREARAGISNGEETPASGAADATERSLWIEEVLQIEGLGARAAPGRFKAYLNAASRSPSRCCYGPTRSSAGELVAGGVPVKLKVQQFSNRLPGGSSRAPKRNACATCREAWRVERLTLPKGKEKSIYAHFVPPSWWPARRLESARSSFQRALEALPAHEGEEPTCLQLDLARLGSSSFTTVPVQPWRGPGNLVAFGVPRASEALGPTFFVPIATGIDGTAPRLLHALHLAGHAAVALGAGLVLSESSVLVEPPPPGGSVVVGLPASLEPFLGGPVLSRERLVRGLEALDAVAALERVARPEAGKTEPRNAVSIAQALSGGDLRLAFLVDRWIERRAKGNERQAGWAARDAWQPLLRTIADHATIRARLDAVVALARECRESGLIGRSEQRRGKLLRPLTTVLDGLRRAGSHLDLETVLAAATTEVASHWARTDGRGASAIPPSIHVAARRLTSGVHVLLRDFYRGQRAALLADEGGIVAAFLLSARAEGATGGPERAGGTNRTRPQEVVT